MYRVISRWLPIQKECFIQLSNTLRGNDVKKKQQIFRQLSLSVVCSKKRKSIEERAVENKGGRVIRYTPKSGSGVVGIWRNMTVEDIANVLEQDTEHVFKALEFADKNSTVQYKKNTVIHNPQIIRDIVKISGFRSKIVPPPDEEIEEEESRDAVPAPPAAPEALRPRPPVACVMGHVDHGKTTLLDSLRDSRVVDREFGGITQHIGAFEVSLPSGDRVTFLDTPGHAAFSAMRSRGARGADVVVLVVAADDGAMEQTREAVRMAREAGVPILVAINKIDKPNANIDKTIRSLAQLGLVCEAIGGDIQAVPISALKKINLDTLVEALILQAQMMDLKADYGGYVEGVVIEALVDPRIGKQATVLVQRGTLRRGCVLVAGRAWCKVRVLSSSEGLPMQEASPAIPAVVLGWRELPAAGDLVLEVASEKRAHEVMRWRANQRMREKQASDSTAIEEKEREHQTKYRAALEAKRAIGRMRMRPTGPREKMIKDDGEPTLSVVVKGDVDGSVEAILELLDSYDDHSRVKLELVHAGVGQVTPNDLEIAEAFNAIIYAFNLPCPPAIAAEAKSKNIVVKEHNVIYKLADDVKEEINLRIPVTQEEEIIGEANVLQQFLVSEGKRKVPVAGCRCSRGVLHKNALYKLVRGGEVLFQGKLASMKHLKDEVATIKKEQECGLRLEGGFEVKPGDVLICYKMVDVAATTNWDPGF